MMRYFCVILVKKQSFISIKDVLNEFQSIA